MLKTTPTATGQRWTKWKKRFENFLLAMDIDDETCKPALLLHYIGSSAFDIFETLTDTSDKKDYKKAMDCLTKHFTPQRNVDYEIYLLSTSPTTKWDARSIYHSSVPTGLNLQIYLCWERNEIADNPQLLLVLPSSMSTSRIIFNPQSTPWSRLRHGNIWKTSLWHWI